MSTWTSSINTVWSWYRDGFPTQQSNRKWSVGKPLLQYQRKANDH